MKRTKNRRHFANKKIPFGVVAGFLPLVKDVGGALVTGNYHMAQWYAVDHLTGYDIDQKRWGFNALVKGWTPIILGVMLHKVANKLGINRAIKGIPFVQI